MDQPTNQAFAEALARIGESGKLTKADKKWLTKTREEMQEHERNMRILELMLTDNDLFWKLILLGGMGITALGAAFAVIPEITPETVPLPDGLVVGGFLLLPAGITISAIAMIMLAPRQIFGDNGIQFEIEGGVSLTGGAQGNLKVG